MTRATGPLYDVHFRRRREGKTDYAKRLTLVKSGVPRLVVRKTNKFIVTQVISLGEKGDETLVAVTSKALQAFGFTGKANTPSAYLTGLLCGLKATARGIDRIVLDVGLHAPTKGSLVFAALKGAVDAGLKTNFGGEKMPSEERISGRRLGEAIAQQFVQAKQKIMEGAGSVKALNAKAATEIKG